MKEVINLYYDFMDLNQGSVVKGVCQFHSSTEIIRNLTTLWEWTKLESIAS